MPFDHIWFLYGGKLIKWNEDTAKVRFPRFDFVTVIKISFLKFFITIELPFQKSNCIF
jgi:hypothetical protein